MSVDYKKELEMAARNMILVHDPDLLIKMMVRMIVQKVRVTHASMLVYNKENNSYILGFSRGSLGAKIPVGLARIDQENPLVLFFKEHQEKMFFKKSVLLYQELKRVFQNKEKRPYLKGMFAQVLYQMDIFDSVVCIPSYYHEDLLGIVLLGKKKNGRDFTSEELNFFLALASNVAMAIRNAQLFRELETQLQRKQQLFVRTTIALAAAIEAKDNYTHGHTTRVINLSLGLARKINQKDRGRCDEKFLENLHIASLLHDIGKIGVPEHILNKRGVLTIGEKNRIKEHPLIGTAILKPIQELEQSAYGVKYHHERYDGCGYPQGLKGNQIPLIAAIISVADSFDAMTTDRPYRPALARDTAIAQIRDLRGRQFNPQVANAFVELYQEGQV